MFIFKIEVYLQILKNLFLLLYILTQNTRLVVSLVQELLYVLFYKSFRNIDGAWVVKQIVKYPQDILLKKNFKNLILTMIF